MNTIARILSIAILASSFSNALSAEKMSKDKNGDIPLSVLDELSKELAPYIRYQMTITIPNGTTAKKVQIYTRNEENKKKAIEVLKKYEHVIYDYSIHESYSLDEAAGETSKLQIGRYKSSLRTYLLAAVDHIRVAQADENIYAFVVGLSTDHHDISLHWNSESAFESTLNKYLENDPKYATPEYIEGIKYNSGDFTYSTNKVDIKGIKEVWEVFEFQQKLSDSRFDKYGDQYLSFFEPIYKNLMTNATIAVMLELEDEINSLSESQDFVFYLQHWDAPNYIQFDALQRTVSEEKIRKLMKSTFNDFLD